MTTPTPPAAGGAFEDLIRREDAVAILVNELDGDDYENDVPLSRCIERLQLLRSFKCACEELEATRADRDRLMDDAMLHLTPLREAFGLVSTLAPHRIADPSHPIDWAKGIVLDVQSQQDRLAATVERVGNLTRYRAYIGVRIIDVVDADDLRRALDEPVARLDHYCSLCKTAYDVRITPSANHAYGKCVERRKA